MRGIKILVSCRTCRKEVDLNSKSSIRKHWRENRDCAFRPKTRDVEGLQASAEERELAKREHARQRQAVRRARQKAYKSNQMKLDRKKVVVGAGLIGVKLTMHRLLGVEKLSFNYAKPHCKVLRPPKHTPWYHDKRYPHKTKDVSHYLGLLMQSLPR